LAANTSRDDDLLTFRENKTHKLTVQTHPGRVHITVRGQTTEKREIW